MGLAANPALEVSWSFVISRQNCVIWTTRKFFYTQGAVFNVQPLPIRLTHAEQKDRPEGRSELGVGVALTGVKSKIWLIFAAVELWSIASVATRMLTHQRKFVTE
jgi:hypothetical protein